MDAMIFDFDGVVVDSEPIHFRGFREVLAEAGVTLSREDYYGKYLGFDDHDCFAAALGDCGLPAGEREIAKMTAAKTRIVQRVIAESIQALPGSLELIAAAARRGTPLAICSGALREEIVLALRCIGAERHFARIVAAEDVRRGKPDPEGYLLALDQLRQTTGKPLRAERCVVVEDSPAGIESACAAGMKVLAVATSYPPGELTAADRVVDSLARVTPEDLDGLVR